MYYKLGQACVRKWSSFASLKLWANVVLNWAAQLLQIGASVITNRGSYYKLGQPLLQNNPAITNWGKNYYKIGQALQIRTIITNWGITNVIKIDFTAIWVLPERMRVLTKNSSDGGSLTLFNS